jgi:hypothetical protein
VIAALRVGELVSILASLLVIFGAILRQSRKIRQGIVFQLHRIDKLEKMTAEIKRDGSDPMKDLSEKVDRTKKEAILAVSKAEQTAKAAENVASNIKEKIENGSYSPPKK